MQMFLLTLVVLGSIILIMSVGVLMGRKPIAGSCGGMSALGMDTECDICGGNQEICETEQQKNRAAKSGKTDLAYDVGSKK
ncbi:MAG: (Na+)-NQR maturation NqrM [Marinospirillum sp.]|uniref:(Na+)-NQR maturation NqrM n=1 Tax=Marinospirillum sp. TaxID=2183934 RepID=UPI001A0836F4|nr:(Na+)-NQR maturation NqrM [Marinospirillum sp.]MBE0507723.1 (Na+)-NQR maturation NqrM [Marinospirillum sp.]